MTKTKKKKTKKPPKKKNAFWVSREKRCEFAPLFETDNTGCKLPMYELTDTNYVIVYSEKHLLEKRYECGCIVYKNRFYPEFDIPDLIWDDFFGVNLEHGRRLVKFTIAPF